MVHVDLLVLGAGAAGLMAALEASGRGLAVAVVDHGPVVGRKVRLAGGGMGNVTNRQMSAAHFVGTQPAFVTPALKGWTPDKMLRLLESLDIGYEERELGRLFCTDPAARLVEGLVARCEARGVRFLLRREVGRVEQRAGGGFEVDLSGEQVASAALLVALGSGAWPSAGATDRGLAVARGFGHRIVPPYPVLTPFVMPPNWPLHGLQGISLPVRLETGGQVFEEPLLFTHKGVSGPVVLRASCHWRPGMELRVDFLPALRVGELLNEPGNGRLDVASVLRRALPARLAEALVPPELAGIRAAEIGRVNRQRLEAAVHHHVATPGRTEGMARAEAAGGGVDTACLDPKTLESRLVPGLYFAGEVVDIAGLLGGYNLHWAFASGRAAGEAAARRNRP